MKIFLSSHVGSWWMGSTSSFLDAPHTCVQHLCQKFYCGTANRKGNTTTANLLFRVSTTAGREKLWFRVLDSDPISVRTKAPQFQSGLPMMHRLRVWRTRIDFHHLQVCPLHGADPLKFGNEECVDPLKLCTVHQPEKVWVPSICDKTFMSMQ